MVWILCWRLVRGFLNVVGCESTFSSLNSFFILLFLSTILAECRELRRRICELCAARPSSLLSLLRQQSQHKSHHGGVIPSGIPALDQQLQGGFRVGTVTELFGKAGTGKTQLAMQICVETARKGH